MRAGNFVVVTLLIACGDSDGNSPDAAQSPSDDAAVTIDAAEDIDADMTAKDGLIVINEVLYDPSGDNTGNQWIELRNADSKAINIGGWQLCRVPAYYGIPANTILQPGDIITIHWNASGTDTQTELFTNGAVAENLGDDDQGTDQVMALYQSTSFGSAAAIRDFVQWAAGTQGRSDVAVPSVWTDAAMFVADAPEGSSICFNGGTTQSPADFAIDPTPTQGAANANCD